MKIGKNKRNNVLGINGSFLRKPATGIGQVSWHFIETLLKGESGKYLSKKKIIIYLEEQLDQKTRALLDGKDKSNVEFKIVSGWYKRDDLIRKILWEKFWLPKQVKRDACDKFLSLYQSVTILPKTVKHSMFVHDIVPKKFPEYLNNFRKKIYYFLVDKAILQADKILTVSKFSQQEIAKEYHLQSKNIAVHYIDCDSIFKKELDRIEKKKSLQKYGLKLENKYIFSFGGIDTRKNVARVIEAYGRLVGEIEGVPDLVIGGDFQKHLIPLVTDVEKVIEKVCKKYKIDKNKFKTIGFVEQKDLSALYQSAELFVYPSLYEGFGIPVLEAMNSGCPVVTSATSSIPEVISPQSGWLVKNPENVKEIENKMKQVLRADNQEQIKQKTTFAKGEAQKFSWKKFTQGIMKEI